MLVTISILLVPTRRYGVPWHPLRRRFGPLLRSNRHVCSCGISAHYQCCSTDSRLGVDAGTRFAHQPQPQPCLLSATRTRGVGGTHAGPCDLKTRAWLIFTCIWPDVVGRASWPPKKKSPWLKAQSGSGHVKTRHNPKVPNLQRPTYL